MFWPQNRPPEIPVQEIPLSGALSADNAELSGLAWFDNELVLLPQFPARYAADDDTGAVFAYEKRAIERYLRGGKLPHARRIGFDSGPLADLPGYEGFEAIAFVGRQVFATVEAENEDRTLGYLAKGVVSEDGSSITFSEDFVELRAQSDIDNLAYEALLVQDDRVTVFYEANGECNQHPMALSFDQELQPVQDDELERLEFRLTDATSIDRQGRFWVSNYFWGGDTWNTGSCPLQARFGVGESHENSRNVERIVELERTEHGIQLSERAPIQLALSDSARNWEGIARLDGKGLLMVTDEHPRTMLAFVELPAQ
ncbi:MAG: hypothetical protein AAGF12_10710 [Myxococcota bacterium]